MTTEADSNQGPQEHDSGEQRRSTSAAHKAETAENPVKLHVETSGYSWREIRITGSSYGNSM